MLGKITLNNVLAIISFALAKMSGMTGIVLSFTKYHSLGGGMLILDGILLVLTVILCLVEMRRQNQEDNKNHSMVDNMLQDGTLQQYLQESGFKIVKK